MEFLYPDEGDSHVILLLVISKGGTSRAVWYEWDTKTNLTEAAIKTSSFTLCREISLPLLLIPLRAHHAFILAGQNTTYLFKNILTGTPSQHTLQLGTYTGLERNGTSRYCPTWVQWARAVRYRRSESSTVHNARVDDNVYLCREDGVVLFLDISNDLSHMVESHHSAGRLGASINNAFAVIDLGEYSVDLLVAGGDSGSGGVWQFSPRENALQTLSLTNWSPLIDLQCASIAEKSVAPVGTEQSCKKSSILACHGPLVQGCVSQFGFGIKATSLDILSLQDGTQHSIKDAWTVFTRDHTCFLAMSCLSSTIIIKIEDDSELEFLLGHESFVLDDETVLMEGMAMGTVCQVTRHAIVLSFPTSTTSKVVWRHDVEVGEQIVAACTTNARSNSYLATTIQTPTDFFVTFQTLEEDPVRFPNLVSIEDYPTSMAIFSDGFTTLLCVATENGMLEVFKIARQGYDVGYERVGIWNFPHPEDICDSIVIVWNAQTPRVVCGLRNGMVHILGLDDNTRKLDSRDQAYEELIIPAQFIYLQELYIGNTTVRIKQSTSAPQHLYLSCDNRLFAIELPDAQAMRMPAHLRHVNPCDITGSTVAAEVLALIPPQREDVCSDTRARLFVFVTRKDVHFSLFDTASFELSPRRPRPTSHHQNAANMTVRRPFTDTELGVIPTNLEATENPSRVTYSAHLKQLIILSSGFSTFRSVRGISKRLQMKRRTSATITFLNADSLWGLNTVCAPPYRAQSPQSKPSRHIMDPKPGERFLGLMEWRPNIDECDFAILLINTLIKNKTRTSSGRLLFYSMTLAAGRVKRLDLKKALDFKTPVYSVTCLWDKSSIVLGTGNDLTILRVKSSDSGLKYETQSRTTLSSPARSVSAQEPYIFVSTANESCQVYTIKNERLQHLYGDSVSRNAACHLSMHGSDILAAGDMQGRVVGLWRPSVGRLDNALPSIFEATLPKAVTRLFQVFGSSRERDVMFPGGPIVMAEGCRSLNDPCDYPIHDHRHGALIGSSTDGTIFQMNVIDRGWKLLRFMQSLCDESQIICPFKSATWIPPPEGAEDDPKYRHIDGDILKRLLLVGGTDRLLKMLAVTDQTQDIAAEEESVNERWERFLTLAMEIFGREFIEKADNKTAVVSEILRWISYMTRSAL